MIGGKIDLRLAFPALPGADAKGHARAATQNADQFQCALRMVAAALCQQIEGQDDQAVAGQHCQRFGIGQMHRGLAPAQRRIIKTGQVIMHQACAMDQLQRRRRCIRQSGAIIATSQRHAEQDRGPDPRAAGCHRVMQRRGQPWRGNAALPQRNRRSDGSLDPRVQLHCSPPWRHCQTKVTGMCKSYWTVRQRKSTLTTWRRRWTGSW